MIDENYKPDRQTWEDFQKSKLLWFVNRSLHIFGWAIVYEKTSTGLEVYPARVRYRGFSPEDEHSGFIGLTHYLSTTIKELEQDIA